MKPTLNETSIADQPAAESGAERLRGLSAEERQCYVRDGIVFPIRVLSEEEVCRYRSACDDLERRLGGRPRTVEVRQMHLHFRWAYDLATHPRVTDCVEALLGSDLLVWASELFAKHPFDSGVKIGWHRDRPYMGFDSKTAVTAWISLGASASRNGCMRAVADPDRQAADLDESRAVDVILLPGEMSLHDLDIWHGSPPNHSAEKRVGFAVRYVTPAARPLSGRPPAVVARGCPISDHFEIVGPPAAEQSDDSLDGAIADMRRSAALHFDAVLENLSQKDG